MGYCFIRIEYTKRLHIILIVCRLGVIKKGINMECTSCLGKGEIFGIGCPGFKPIVIDCDLCGSTGKINATKESILEGNRIKAERLDNGKSLRTYCKENNIDPIIQSKLEHGIIEI